jgi:hypothetical protein
MSDRMRSSLRALFAAPLAVVAITATSAPASAEPKEAVAATASSESRSIPTDEPGVLISERQCDVGERPRQIVIFLGIGGEEGQRCFGGTIGSIGLGDAPVFDLFSGDYTGAIDCTNRLHMFRPNQQVIIIDTCQTLAILPGS